MTVDQVKWRDRFAPINCNRKINKKKGIENVSVSKCEINTFKFYNENAKLNTKNHVLN